MNAPDRNEPVDDYLKRIWGSEIKPGREDNIVRTDHAFAKDLDARLSAEPQADGVVAPITHALPVGVAPVEYVIHVWTHKCSMCQSEHKHSEVFAVNHIRTGYRGIDNVVRPGSTFVRNMTPVARLEWQVPIKVHNITTRITAGCFECLDALREEVLPTLPKPPVPQAILKSEGAQAPARPDRRAKEPKRPLSADDFLL